MLAAHRHIRNQTSAIAQSEVKHANPRVMGGAQMWKSIQALRGVAALMVVLFHIFSEYGLIAGSGIATDPLQAGVDVFFVISGFVMVTATAGREIGKVAFLTARLIRIVPLYWLALAVQLAVLTSGAREAPPAWDVIQAYLFIPYRNSLTGDITPYLTLGWTLSYELYFYAVFCFTLRMKALRQVGTLAVVFGIAVLLRHVFGSESPIAFRLTSPLPLEFLSGVILAHVLRRRAVPIIAGILLMVTAILLWLSPWHLLPRTLGFGVPALFLVAGAAIVEPWFRARALRPFKALGDASYSLYLTHVFAIMAVLALLPTLPWALGTVSMVILSVLLALLVHALVERPLIRRLKRAGRSLVSS